MEPPVVVDGFLLLPSLVMTFQLVGTWSEKTSDVYCVNIGFSFSRLGAAGAAAKAGAAIHAVLTPTPTTRDWNKARLPTGTSSTSTCTCTGKDDVDVDVDEALTRVGAVLLPSCPPPKPKVQAEETTTRRAKIRKVPSIFIISVLCLLCFVSLLGLELEIELD